MAAPLPAWYYSGISFDGHVLCPVPRRARPSATCQPAVRHIEWCAVLVAMLVQVSGAQTHSVRHCQQSPRSLVVSVDAVILEYAYQDFLIRIIQYNTIKFDTVLY